MPTFAGLEKFSVTSSSKEGDIQKADGVDALFKKFTGYARRALQEGDEEGLKATSGVLQNLAGEVKADVTKAASMDDPRVKLGVAIRDPNALRIEDRVQRYGANMDGYYKNFAEAERARAMGRDPNNPNGMVAGPNGFYNPNHPNDPNNPNNQARQNQQPEAPAPKF